MATCVARSTTFDVLERVTKLDTTEDGWPVAALRTYLWAMSQQTSPLFYDDTDTFSCEIFTAPDTCSRLAFDVMAQPSVATAALGNSTPPSARRSSFPSSHHLRQAQSCNDLSSSVTSPRYSLPSSPRFPPPLARSPTPMRSSQADLRSVPNSSSTKSAARSHRVSDSLDVPVLDPRGRAILSSRPSSRATSPTPSIILTPPQTDLRSRRGSFISLYSSPSTGYTSDAPTSYDAASESESVWSEASDCAKSRPAAVRELVLEMFRDNYKEELKVPNHVISKGAVEFVSNLYSGSEFLTIDNSEFLPSPLSFRPGAHGYVVPCAWTLHDMLKLQADCNYGGCHIFVTHRNSDARYYGYYRVIQRDIPLAQWEWLRMPKKMRASIARTYFGDESGRTSPTQERENLRRLDEGEDALYPVFFQFLYYDWDLYHLMTKHMKARETKHVDFTSDSSDSSSEVDVPVKRPFRPKPSPLRIVTVDGINFEMAPTSVAWQHD